MSGYLSVIKTAIFLFPFLAFLVSLPIFAIQYRKNESFILWRAVVIYTFIFYLLAAYCLIILPLPDRSVVATLTTPKWNLQPFQFITEFIKYSPLVIADPDTYVKTLVSPQFIQPTFNLLLTLPFGVYLRYYFNRSWWQVLIMSFGLSLFFELTQLSGLYGIYVRPYRLFDVDDLMLNTAGAMIGFWMAPLLTRLFPSAQELEKLEVKAAEKVTIMRRLVAWLIDMVVFLLINTLLSLVIRDFHFADLLVYVISVIGYFIVLPYFFDGQTVGKWFVRIQMVNEDQTKIGFWRLVLRQAQLYLIIVPFMFIWTPQWLTATGVVDEVYLQSTYWIAVTSLTITGIFLLSIAVNIWRKAPRLIYEVIAKTRTIAVKKDRSHER